MDDLRDTADLPLEDEIRLLKQSLEHERILRGINEAASKFSYQEGRYWFDRAKELEHELDIQKAINNELRQQILRLEDRLAQ